ncbi:ferritin-like domain-containing protein [Hyphococcus luteus]|uniref:DUF2202 domain-containing protein n=1 Tax=Hyphococcus luteus TaxID=2058213 RepID=A0A2S7KAL2_9PROT|nr:DUF2202 domain-containing protein [Marinicaulis flavus]PQA89527.1 DUF2202 domain-containing protein [Marinicaulis flavus]
MTHALTIAAMTEAIEDEYKAQAAYEAVIEKFGLVRPFINIVDAEARHADALRRQFERLGASPPADQWKGKARAPATLREACEQAVAGEVENAAMYDRLLAQVEDQAVRQVLFNLKDASQSRHLPAFRRALAREASRHR